MKKYAGYFLLCLFKNLGKLIPYFKRKYMALMRDSILNAINNHNRIHFNLYGDINLFSINDGIILLSDMNYHKIQYKVIYNNSLEFNINLVYDEGLVKKTFFIPTECNNGNPINSFFNHFTSDQFDLTELLSQLNDAV